MPLLYHWRGDNYRRDLDHGVGYHLNQANPLLHDVVLGDSLWAFARARDGAYALAAELVVSARTRNPPGFRYGPYRVWGDLRRSRYFSVDGQPDITPLVRSMAIATGHNLLGRAFQGRAAVRRLGEADHARLADYARHLSPEPRARLLPEERLEALMLSGDEDAVAQLLRDEPSGLAEERRRYLLSQVTLGGSGRDRRLILQLRDLYDGACQLCGWAPRRCYGADICEVHHLRWLSRGGPDAIGNLVLVCPNHHRIIHNLDAPYDFGIGGFLFGSTTERLATVLHELTA